MDWLRSILTVDKVKQLLGHDYVGNDIFRFELPNIWGKFFSIYFFRAVSLLTCIQQLSIFS